MNNSNPILSCGKYKNGFFPRVPTILPNRATLLRSIEKGDVIYVNDRTTPRDISTGKYNEKIDIDLTIRTIQCLITVPSKNSYYNFNVSVSLETRVVDPLTFYLKGTLDLVECVKPKLSPSVRRIARKYGTTNFVGMDDDITNYFSDKKYDAEEYGLEYVVIDACCEPSTSEHIKSISDISVTSDIERYKQQKANDIKDLDIQKIIFGKVLTGDISSETAINQIIAFYQSEGRRKLDNLVSVGDVLNTLREQEVFNEEEIKFLKIKMNVIPEQISNNSSDTSNNESDEFPDSKTAEEIYKKEYEEETNNTEEEEVSNDK